MLVIEDIYSQLKNSLVSLGLEISSAICDDLIVLTAKSPRKIIKVKLPKREYSLMGVDVLLIDLENSKQYAAYETELNAKMLANTLSDLEVVAAKFLTEDYIVECDKLFFGLINNCYLEFDVNGAIYVYSEIKFR